MNLSSDSPCDSLSLRQQPAVVLLQFMEPYVAGLWKEWPMIMTATSLGDGKKNEFTLSGICPHCCTDRAEG